MVYSQYCKFSFRISWVPLEHFFVVVRVSYQNLLYLIHIAKNFSGIVILIFFSQIYTSINFVFILNIDTISQLEFLEFWLLIVLYLFRDYCTIHFLYNLKILQFVCSYIFFFLKLCFQNYLALFTSINI